MVTNKRQLQTVNCPTCGDTVEWSAQQPWRPFCSERCKLIDLGTWFDESNRIPDDSETPAIPDQDD